MWDHWDVYNRERWVYQAVEVVSKLTTARRGFRCRLPTSWRGAGKTGKGDDKEGFRLVTDAGGS